MGAGYVNLELQHTDTYPLLMDHNTLASNNEAAISVLPGASRSLDDFRSGHSEGMPSSPPENIVVAIDQFDNVKIPPPSQADVDHLPSSSSLARSTSTSSHSQPFPAASLRPSSPQENIVVAIDQSNNVTIPLPSQADVDLPSSSSLARSTSTSSRSQSFPAASVRSSRNNSLHGAQQGTNASNSGSWILLDIAISVAQIIASVLVLSLSRNKNPQAPLALWLIGYACGCVAMLPVLCWRFKHRYARQQDRNVPASSSVSSTSTPSSLGILPSHISQQSTELDGASFAAAGSTVHSREASRIGMHMERFKLALDCFFAIWFVIGTVWIFGGHISSHDAPNLYRLCIVFLAFSCISYAMPFAICATLCCCLPCIIALLRHREQRTRVKGAAPEVISGLPIYKFKTKEPKERACSDGNDSNPEILADGGIFAPGTDKERFVSGEDAVCCICLGQYRDGVDLKELQCTHFFHVECVDKWLKISATCPLCKYELSGSGNGDQYEESRS